MPPESPGRSSTPPLETTAPSPIRKRTSELDSDSKVQFTFEHAFGDSDFSHAGTFTARFKSWPHGGQDLLKDDEFYRVRLSFNVLSPTGRNYTLSTIKASTREMRSHVGDTYNISVTESLIY